MNYKNTQIGTIMLTLMALSATLTYFAAAGFPDSILWMTFALIFCLTAYFSTLTIKVNNERILWFFGPELCAQSLPLSEITRADIVDTPWYDCIGLKLTTDGWHYSPAGTQAVQLTLQDGTSVTLGTDAPEKLIETIKEKV